MYVLYPGLSASARRTSHELYSATELAAVSAVGERVGVRAEFVSYEFMDCRSCCRSSCSSLGLPFRIRAMLSRPRGLLSGGLVRICLRLAVFFRTLSPPTRLHRDKCSRGRT